MSSDADEDTLRMLRRIDSKLDALIEQISGVARPRDAGSVGAAALAARADGIASLTPAGVQQTDAVELLRQDRDR